MNLPSRENATFCSDRPRIDGRSMSPVKAFQTMMTSNRERETTFVPSAENATDRIHSPWTLNGSSSATPVFAAHIRIVQSVELETMRCPSAEKATARTGAVCPTNGGRRALPDSASHNLMVPSSEPDTIDAPSGEYATSVTSPELPSNTFCQHQWPLRSLRVVGYELCMSDGRYVGPI